MKKGDITVFSSLEIGDYFSDKINDKYRKIVPSEVFLPDQPSIIYNAFDIQRHRLVKVNPDEKIVFIKLSAWQKDEKVFELSVEESELEHRLDELNDYLEILNDFLKSQLQKYDREEITIDADELEDLMQKSFIVSLYAFLERELDKDCKQLQRSIGNTTFSLEDAKGKTLERAKSYLTEIGCRFPFDKNEYWQEIRSFNKLRNLIIHNNGKITNDHIRKYVEQAKGLSIFTSFREDYIVVEYEFCKHALSIVGEFLTSLLYYCQAAKIQ